MYLFLYLTYIGYVSAVNLTIFPPQPNGIENEDLEVVVDLGDTSFAGCSFMGSLGDVVNASGSTNETLFYEENAEKTKCKLIIKPMTNNFKGKWQVALEINETERPFAEFSVGMIVPTPVDTNRSESAEVGSKYQASCVPGEFQTYAKIYKPDGVLLTEGTSVQLSIPFVRVIDEGIWRCDVQMSDRTEQVTVYINLNVTSGNDLHTSVSETETQVQLLCQSSVFQGSCIFESPTSKLFSPKPGVVKNRITYFGSNQNTDCGLAITKPLNDGEKGMWHCFNSRSQTSAFLEVGGTSDDVDEGTTKTPNISLVHGDELTIQCSKQQPLTYCFLRSPRNRIFSETTTDGERLSNYTGLGLGMGDCQITVAGDKIWKNETGTWFCGMGATNLDDTQVAVEVEIADSQFGAKKAKFNANLNEELSITCRSTLSYGLKYCRFMHPRGQSLNLSPQIRSSEKYSYQGKGLQHGECGLLIKTVEESDLGEWICAATFIGDQWPYEFSHKIMVEQTPISFEAMVSISVVLGVAGLAAVGGFIWWERRRRIHRSYLHDPPVVYRSNTANASESSSQDSFHLS